MTCPGVLSFSYWLVWATANDTRCTTAFGDIGAAFKGRHGKLMNTMFTLSRLGRWKARVTYNTSYDSNQTPCRDSCDDPFDLIYTYTSGTIPSTIMYINIIILTSYPIPHATYLSYSSYSSPSPSSPSSLSPPSPPHHPHSPSSHSPSPSHSSPAPTQHPCPHP